MSIKNFDFEALYNVFPHRYPFLLLDKVLEFKRYSHCVALKNVTANEEFFNGHFPGFKILPAVLQLEMMAQTLGAIFMLSDPSANQENDLPYDVSHIKDRIDSHKVSDLLTATTKIKNAVFRKKVVPGDTLLIKSEVTAVRGYVCKSKSVIIIRDIMTNEETLASESEIMLHVLLKSHMNQTGQ